MALKQEHALLIGLATAAAVYGVFQIHLPPVASVRASQANNKHVDTSRKSATITSAALVAIIGLLAHDPTVFVIGGVTTIALDTTHRVANATDSQSGQVPNAAQAAGTAGPQTGS
jgi:xanthine dehydrogenase iron-sulfur cluster and FAD-binding subunit A